MDGHQIPDHLPIIESGVDEQRIRRRPEEIGIDRSYVTGEEVGLLDRLPSDLRPEAGVPSIHSYEVVFHGSVDPDRRIVPTSTFDSFKMKIQNPS